VQKESAQRSGSGLSLKEYAAAVASRSSPHLNPEENSTKKPPSVEGIPEARDSAAAAAASGPPKRSRDKIAADASAASDDDLADHVNGWLKRQRTDQPVLEKEKEAAAVISFDEQGFEATTTTRHSSNGHITPPAPENHMMAIPVTNTPMMHPYQLHQRDGDETDRLEAAVAPSSPPHMPPSPSHLLSANSPEAATATYSPAMWNRRHLDDDEDEVDIGDWKPHAYDPAGDNQQPFDDVLHAAAASALTNDIPEGEYPLLSGDDIPHRSLNLSELE
jgi:hypothetical protein